MTTLDELRAHLTRDAIVPTRLDSFKALTEKKRLIETALEYHIPLADILGIDNGLTNGSTPEEHALASMTILQYEFYIQWRNNAFELPTLWREEHKVPTVEISVSKRKHWKRRVIALNRLYRVEAGHYSLANLKWWMQNHHDFINLLTAMDRVVGAEFAMHSGTALSPEELREYKALRMLAAEFASLGWPVLAAARGQQTIRGRINAYKAKLQGQTCRPVGAQDASEYDCNLRMS
ncbi:hypothetical protein OC845_002060 [Tilletia horrida]|nr:hypothetical protein OC845_002060 [Tilletia horrida]